MTFSAMTPVELQARGISVFAYQVDGTDIRIERRSKKDAPEAWAVTNGRSCLNLDLEWEYEPNSSNRTDDFLSRCRFSLDGALGLALQAKERAILGA